VTRWAGGRPSAVFLDRDGTINVKAPPGAYITEPSELRLIPGAAAAVRRLNDAGLPAVLVTNQRWIASAGPGAEDRYLEIHRRLVDLLAADGARLDAAYHCPHEAGTCRCRKPAPGMLLAAARDLELDLPSAAMVGDAESDIGAATAAGVAGIRIGTPADPAQPSGPAFPDLRAAVSALLT
jgi:D-glycero-D-manno-heptose 1,7-bisphosphate phosphatase